MQAEVHQVSTRDDAHHEIVHVGDDQVPQPHGAEEHVRAVQGEVTAYREGGRVDVGRDVERCLREG